jgi:hypothetical protein
MLMGPLRKVRNLLTYDQFLRDSLVRESLELSWSSKIFEIGSPEHAIAPTGWEKVEERGRMTRYLFFIGPTEYLVQITRTFDSRPNIDVEFYANGDRDS